MKKRKCKSVDDQIRTATRRGPVGADPLVYRWTRQFLNERNLAQQDVLDFGAGRYMRQAPRFADQTYAAHDLGLDPEQEPLAMSKDQILAQKWDFLLVSNVLNIQPRISDLRDVCRLLRRIKFEKMVVNYPADPRWLPDQTLGHMHRRICRLWPDHYVYQMQNALFIVTYNFISTPDREMGGRYRTVSLRRPGKKMIERQ